MINIKNERKFCIYCRKESGELDFHQECRVEMMKPEMVKHQMKVLVTVRLDPDLFTSANADNHYFFGYGSSCFSNPLAKDNITHNLAFFEEYFVDVQLPKINKMTLAEKRRLILENEINLKLAELNELNRKCH